MGRMADQKITDAIYDLKSAAESLLKEESNRAQALGCTLQTQIELIEGLIPMIREEIYEEE